MLVDNEYVGIQIFDGDECFHWTLWYISYVIFISMNMILPFGFCYLIACFYFYEGQIWKESAQICFDDLPLLHSNLFVPLSYTISWLSANSSWMHKYKMMLNGWRCGCTSFVMFIGISNKMEQQQPPPPHPVLLASCLLIFITLFSCYPVHWHS